MGDGHPATPPGSPSSCHNQGAPGVEWVEGLRAQREVLDQQSSSRSELLCWTGARHPQRHAAAFTGHWGPGTGGCPGQRLFQELRVHSLPLPSSPLLPPPPLPHPWLSRYPRNGINISHSFQSPSPPHTGALHRAEGCGHRSLWSPLYPQIRGCPPEKKILLLLLASLSPGQMRPSSWAARLHTALLPAES